MSSQKEPNRDDLVELGKKLQAFYDSGYVNKKQALLFTFYKGIVSGLGVFIGGTIVIGLLLWILGLFNTVPIASHFVRTLHHTLQNK